MKIYDENKCELDKKDSQHHLIRDKSSEAEFTLSEDDFEISDTESQHLLNESKRFIKNISHNRKNSSVEENNEKRILPRDSDDSDEDCYFNFKRQSKAHDQDEDSASSSDEDYLPVDTSENKSSSGSSAEEDLPVELPSAETKAIMTASKDFIREEVMQRRRSSLRQKEKRQEHHGVSTAKCDDIAEYLSEDECQTSDVEDMTSEEKLFKKFKAKLIATGEDESIEKLSDEDSSDEDFCPVDNNDSHDSHSSDEQMELSDEEMNLIRDKE